MRKVKGQLALIRGVAGDRSHLINACPLPEEPDETELGQLQRGRLNGGENGNLERLEVRAKGNTTYGLPVSSCVAE